jgi:cellulose synthase/poly-beta-1,6-N-acetylglucosamine synthase-like glycosyltransferase
MVFEILFWGSLTVLIYVFFGFVAVLWLTALVKQRPVQKKSITPSVSIIVCAFNEEKHIRQKIQNCLELDYPKDRLEIIVVSDGSTDGTDRLLAELNEPLMRVHRIAVQRGKTACQNAAAAMAKHELLFFTDATVMHPPVSLKILVRGLTDPTVGCVTGRPVFNRDDGAASRGQGKREKYEMFLRTKLGEAGTLFGAQDCMYVIPRKLYMPVRADLDSGFVGPLQLLDKGYRTIYEPKAIAFIDRRPPTIQDEFARRSRIALRGMRGLLYMKRLMNPFRHGFVAIALLSTRLLRWLSPVFLIVLFGSNLTLLHEPFYRFTLLLQAGFYLTALAGYWMAGRGYHLVLPLYIPLYFCVMAYSAIIGLMRLVAGERGQLWQTRR